MKFRFLKFSVSILVSLVIIIGLLWVFVNYVFIPKIVDPKIQDYINSYQSGPLKLSIGKIDFNPFTGFKLQNVNFSGNVVLKDNTILSAKTVDIDIALLPLLKKRIRIEKFEMSGTILNIGRDENGNWNFIAFLNLLDGQEGEDVDIVINEFNVSKGRLYYADYGKKVVLLERDFCNAGVSLKRSKDSSYELIASGNAVNKNEESFELKLHYDINKNSVNGKVKLNTKNIEEYCNYYLKEVLNPWHLKAENISMESNFSYNAKTWLLNGHAKMQNGAFSYGEYVICGNAAIKHELKYTESTNDTSSSRLELSLESISLLLDKDVIISNSGGTAVITENEIKIESLTGQLREDPFSCYGVLKNSELYLNGKIGDLNSSIQLKVQEENKGIMDWRSDIGNSYVKLRAEINNLEKLFFTASLEGNIKLLDLFETTDKITGAINLAGTIERQSEGRSAFKEELQMNVCDFSMLGLEPISFNFNLDIKDGILTGNIPETGFCKGSLRGLVKMDFSRWGVELHVDDFDMGEFSKTDAELEGIRGVFNGNISLVSGWDDFRSAKGGGYFQFKDCYLWNAPIFKQTIEGVKTVVKDVETPDFRRFEGNFEIGEKNITVDYVYVDVSPLKLNIKGKITLQGSVNFTVGVMLSSGSIFRSIRQILLPGTILFDVVANCVEVDIYNTWKDLKYNVGIQPAAFITAIFPGIHYTPVPDKYNLEGFWSPPAKEEKIKKSPAIQPRKKKK